MSPLNYSVDDAQDLYEDYRETDNILNQNGPDPNSFSGSNDKQTENPNTDKYVQSSRSKNPPQSQSTAAEQTPRQSFDSERDPDSSSSEQQLEINPEVEQDNEKESSESADSKEISSAESNEENTSEEQKNSQSDRFNTYESSDSQNDKNKNSDNQRVQREDLTTNKEKREESDSDSESETIETWTTDQDLLLQSALKELQETPLSNERDYLSKLMTEHDQKEIIKKKLEQEKEELERSIAEMQRSSGNLPRTSVFLRAEVEKDQAEEWTAAAKAKLKEQENVITRLLDEIQEYHDKQRKKDLSNTEALIKSSRKISKANEQDDDAIGKDSKDTRLNLQQVYQELANQQNILGTLNQTIDELQQKLQQQAKENDIIQNLKAQFNSPVSETADLKEQNDVSDKGSIEELIDQQNTRLQHLHNTLLNRDAKLPQSIDLIVQELTKNVQAVFTASAKFHETFLQQQNVCDELKEIKEKLLTYYSDLLYKHQDAQSTKKANNQPSQRTSKDQAMLSALRQELDEYEKAVVVLREKVAQQEDILVQQRDKINEKNQYLTFQQKTIIQLESSQTIEQPALIEASYEQLLNFIQQQSQNLIDQLEVQLRIDQQRLEAFTKSEESQLAEIEANHKKLTKLEREWKEEHDTIEDDREEVERLKAQLENQARYIKYLQNDNTAKLTITSLQSSLNTQMDLLSQQHERTIALQTEVGSYNARVAVLEVKQSSCQKQMETMEERENSLRRVSLQFSEKDQGELLQKHIQQIDKKIQESLPVFQTDFKELTQLTGKIIKQFETTRQFKQNSNQISTTTASDTVEQKERLMDQENISLGLTDASILDVLQEAQEQMARNGETLEKITEQLKIRSSGHS